MICFAICLKFLFSFDSELSPIDPFLFGFIIKFSNFEFITECMSFFDQGISIFWGTDGTNLDVDI